MAVWQSQANFPSATARTRQTVAHLRAALDGPVLLAAEDYFQTAPDGEQVTLACLAAVGEEPLRSIAERRAEATGIPSGRAFHMVKQHFGLLVPILLAERFGAERVLTYRQSVNGPSSTRKVPYEWKSRLPWVTSYTPHRLITRNPSGSD